jgi:hypothetical protein
MPRSVDEAVQRAEELERKAHDEILEYRMEEAVGRPREALAIREAYQGEAHPDLMALVVMRSASRSVRVDRRTG